VSIAKDIYKEEICGMLHLDLIRLSEEEHLQKFLSVDKTLLKFTAPQIEKIRLDAVDEVRGVKGIQLKFYDLDPFFLKQEKDLKRCISPGLVNEKHCASSYGLPGAETWRLSSGGRSGEGDVKRQGHCSFASLWKL